MHHRVVAPVPGPDPSIQYWKEGKPRASMSRRATSVRPLSDSTGHTCFVKMMPPVGAYGAPLRVPFASI
jgi:hypothetical protein